VNEARFGWDRYDLLDGNGDCGSNQQSRVNYDALFGFIGGNTAPPGACGFPLVTISGANTFGAANNIADENVLQHTWHFIDSVSLSHGQHQIKFGGEYHRTIYFGVSPLAQSPNGDISFNGGQAFSNAAGTSTGLEDFLAGDPQAGSVLEGAVPTNLNLDRYAGFIQDDYRVTKNVTANLGMRWEYVAPYVEGNNRFGNFDPSTASGMVQQTGGNALYSTSRRNWGPRVGFSWDVTGKGTTVIRAGGSILYDTVNIDDVAASGFGGSLDSVPTGFGLFYCNPAIDTNGQPCNSAANGLVQVASPGTDRSGVVQLSNSCGVGGGNVTTGAGACSQIPWAQGATTFPTGASALNCGDGLAQVPGAGGVLTKPAPCNISIYPKYNPTPYITNWTASVQQAIGSSMSVNIAYVGNHLTNAMMERDLNEPTVGFSTVEAQANAKLAVPLPGITSAVSRRPYNTKYPYFGSILQYGPGGEENYDSLQMTFRKRTSHGLTFNANYTYAHGLSITTGGNNPTILTISNPELSYGTDGRPFHHFGFTTTYDVPKVKAPAQLLEGWKINTAFEYLSANGISVTDTTIDYAGNGSIGRAAFHRGSYFWSDAFAPGGSLNDISDTGFGYVGLRGTQCYAVKGSKLAPAGCNTVTIPGAAVTPAQKAANFPQICQTAAANEPQNAAMNAIDPGISNGLLELVGGSVGGVNQTAFGCWVSANGLAALLAPAQGTFGSMTKSGLRGAPFDEWDFSVSKDTKIRERLTAEIRAEFYNFLNTPVFTGGSGSPTSSTFGRSTSTPNGANPVNGTGGPRLVQLGLKFIF
jgi:hypothetical protein